MEAAHRLARWITRVTRSQPWVAQSGFTYLGLLFLIALLCLALAAASIVHSVESRREKELQLVFAGEQIAAAIDSYAVSSGRVAQPFPTELSELLSDQRSLVGLHHLRQIYVDPMTNSKEWGLLKTPQGGIIGVFSTSRERPLKQKNFPDGLSFPEQAKTYREWHFLATSAQGVVEAGPAPPARNIQSPQTTPRRP